MKKITVLGAGLVGAAIALDLHRQHRVVAADANATALQRLQTRGVATVEADLSDRRRLQELVGDSDLVVGALPGFLGFEALHAFITAVEGCPPIVPRPH